MYVQVSEQKDSADFLKVLCCGRGCAALGRFDAPSHSSHSLFVSLKLKLLREFCRVSSGSEKCLEPAFLSPFALLPRSRNTKREKEKKRATLHATREVIFMVVYICKYNKKKKWLCIFEF